MMLLRPLFGDSAAETRILSLNGPSGQGSDPSFEGV